MTEQTTYIDVGQEKILNLDADDQESYIAFTDNQNVITNGLTLKIDIKIHFPLIRKLDNQSFLLVDSRTDNNSNGHIYNFKGQLIKTFFAGDGIQDIVVHRNKIVITYFDEGVFGADGPNNEGLSVFNFDGEQEFGFNESVKGLHIYDCYCICKHETNKVLFYAYDSFQVIELNLDNFEWKEFKTPSDFKGASAMTSKTDKIIFHSSYDDKKSFFSWDRKTNEVIKFGDYSTGLTGIGNGRFIVYGDSGYTVIDPTE